MEGVATIVVCEDANDGSGRFVIETLSEKASPPIVRVLTLASHADGGTQLRFAKRDVPLSAAAVVEQVRDWEAVARVRSQPIDPAVTKNLYAALGPEAAAARNHERTVFVLTTAVDGIACIIGVAMTNWLSDLAPRTAFLECLVVSPVMQGHRMGRRLVALVESLLRRYNALNIHLVSVLDAVPFWIKQGFVRPPDPSHEALFPEATSRPRTDDLAAMAAGVAYTAQPGFLVKDLRANTQPGVRFEQN